MGQQTIGVLYGAKCPDGVALYDDELDDGGLIAAFDDGLRERGIDPWARGRVNVRADQDLAVVGAWAVESLLWERPSLKSVDLADTTAWLASIAASERGQETIRLWDEFAAFAKSRGVEFDPPTWWLAEHEVA